MMLVIPNADKSIIPELENVSEADLLLLSYNNFFGQARRVQLIL
ncbi:hypothetical protein ACTJIJ_18315 [Niabella sp. 22666]